MLRVGESGRGVEGAGERREKRRKSGKGGGWNGRKKKKRGFEREELVG